MSKLTKESCITILSNSVELAQKRGTYLLQEASLLTKAVDFFKKEDGEKPDFGGSTEPEIVAINLLLQGVTKAQNHRECPFNLHDAALLFDVYEFLVQNSGKDVAKNVGSSAPKKKESKKSAVSALEAVQEESDSEEDDNEIRPMTVSSRKGKERAH